jgi:hypothetical protein
MTYNNNNRWFSTIAGVNHWGPAGSYNYSANVILTGANGIVQSGAWIPTQSDANGNLQVNVVSGTITAAAPTYTKVSSTGYVSGFQPFGAQQVVQGIQIYSKCSLNNGIGYIQIFDGTSLVSPLVVQSGNNSWLKFSENGTVFNNLIISNSTDPVLQSPYNTADFFVNVIYR